MGSKEAILFELQNLLQILTFPRGPFYWSSSPYQVPGPLHLGQSRLHVVKGRLHAHLGRLVKGFSAIEMRIVRTKLKRLDHAVRMRAEEIEGREASIGRSFATRPGIQRRDSF
ncbi:hypothetical protein TWF128_007355 [Orbilia oligospora]|nr:hypothetical protein TWF128_007355 [Orbilia oligospora]